MPAASSFALLPPIPSLLPVPVAPVSSLTSLATLPSGGTPALSPPRPHQSLPADGHRGFPRTTSCSRVRDLLRLPLPHRIPRTRHRDRILHVVRRPLGFHPRFHFPARRLLGNVCPHLSRI